LNFDNIGTASIASFKFIKINFKAEIEITWNIDIDNGMAISISIKSRSFSYKFTFIMRGSSENILQTCLTVGI